jgi:flavin reductase (DIM6/NTAB) family NADH-FMN oxidoreductase RutF
MRVHSNTLSEEAAHTLLKSVVVPRAIAWISTIGVNGVLNAAPFSCFTFVATEPPMVCVSFGRKKNGKKDTLVNIESNGEFVVNIASSEMALAVSATSAEFAPDVSEFTEAGLQSEKSELVKPPRIQGCPVQMECKLDKTMEVGKSRHTLVIGEVLLFHIQDALYKDGVVNPIMLDPLARLSGDYFAKLGDVFEIKR